MDNAAIQQHSEPGLTGRLELHAKGFNEIPLVTDPNAATQKRVLGFKVRTTGALSKQELKPTQQVPRHQVLKPIPPKYVKLPAISLNERVVAQKTVQNSLISLERQRPRKERVQRVRCGSRQMVKPPTTISANPPGQPTLLIGPPEDDSDAPVVLDEFEPRVMDLIRSLLPTQSPDAFLQVSAPISGMARSEVDEESHLSAHHIRAAPDRHLPAINVQTFFSRGEFKLFRYLFHLGDWKRVAKPTLAEYLHYPRERDTDWQQAAQRVVSNIPGIEQFCKKREHSWFANRLKQLHPDLNWYYPDTFILPEEQQEYIEAHTKLKEDIYIAKMSGSRQGVGVRVLAKPSELSLLCGPQEKGFTTAVVQKYVDHPLLLKGIKSDLRLYLMITSIDPPIAFLNREAWIIKLLHQS